MSPLKVTAAEISEQFDALIAGRRSAEEIERWAYERMRAHDARDLEFVPRADEAKLWRAIIYLLGVGLKVSANQYLHSKDDFEAFRRQFNV